MASGKQDAIWKATCTPFNHFCRFTPQKCLFAFPLPATVELLLPLQIKSKLAGLPPVEAREDHSSAGNSDGSHHGPQQQSEPARERLLRAVHGCEGLALELCSVRDQGYGPHDPPRRQPGCGLCNLSAYLLAQCMRAYITVRMPRRYTCATGTHWHAPEDVWVQDD